MGGQPAQITRDPEFRDAPVNFRQSSLLSKEKEKERVLVFS
jgi:hypothetical protein